MASVLVVDDYSDVVDSLERSLKKAGYEVITAYSEKEAIQLLSLEHFDVVVTELVMETDISGLEVLKKAKQLDPFIQVIVLTAYGAVKTAVPAMKLGAFDYVEKSTEIDDEGDVYDKIADTVRKAVEHRIAHKREISEEAADFILTELAKSEVVSLPELLVKSTFHPFAIREGLKVLLEEKKIKKWVVPKADIEVYQRHYPHLRDKILSLISRRSS